MKPSDDFSMLELETEERKIAMLLNKYATDIFDPREGELSPVDEAIISLLMKRTAFIRFAAKTRLKWHPWLKHISAAAVVVTAASSVLLVSNTNDTMQESIPRREFKMRGAETVQATISVEEHDEKEENKDKPQLAYLIDMQGSISVSRGGQSEIVTSSCELMSDGDILEMGAGAKAKLMYEDAMFDISGPMHYRVAAPNPVLLDGEKKDSQINPQLTTRGAHLGLEGDNALVIPPVTLLAQIIPPTTRAGDADVQVFSPCGACYDKCLSLGITGDSNSVYEVSVADMDNRIVVQSVKVRGGATVDGSAVFAAALEEDEIYSIRVKLNGKMVNDVSASSFWLVGNAERTKIDNALKPISSLASDSAKDFFTANVLYASGCHSEAYLLARKLHNAENRNMLYANLLKLCSKALNLKPERKIK